MHDVDFGQVRWSRTLRKGMAAKEIIAAAEENRSDVIVMGSTGRSGLARMLMVSVTRRVLQQLPCSLLTLKQDDIVEQILDEDLRHIRLLMAEGRAVFEHGHGRKQWSSFVRCWREIPSFSPRWKARPSPTKNLARTRKQNTADVVPRRCGRMRSCRP